jgi:hypothetical protein
MINKSRSKRRKLPSYDDACKMKLRLNDVYLIYFTLAGNKKRGDLIQRTVKKNIKGRRKSLKVFILDQGKVFLIRY